MTPPPVTIEATTGDLELDAMALLVTILDRLEPDAQERVLLWALDRYTGQQPTDGAVSP